jgi:hypothetical protein
LTAADTVAHVCEECREVAAVFAEHTWPDIAAESIDARFDSLPLFTPVAFRQFLPAYMIRGLQRGAAEPFGVNDVSEFTVYSLLPDNASEWWLARVSALTHEQAALIREFLDVVIRQSDDYFGAPPSDATAFWEARCRRTRG